MAKYLYSGPFETVPVRKGKRKVDGVDVATFEDVALVRGKVVDLPEGPLVDRLKAAGHLSDAKGEKV